MAVILERGETNGLNDSPQKRTPWRRRPSMWATCLLLWVGQLLMAIRARSVAARSDESGNVITDNLAWIVFGVLVIVAVGALLKTLGSGVINWVQDQLGIGS